jgi:hypothetical protein
MNAIWFLVIVLITALVFVGWINYRTGGSVRKRPGGLSRRALVGAHREVAAREWEQVQGLLAVGRGSSLSAAVIEADKLLDYCLKSLGASGSTLGERLRSAEPRFSDYQGLWQAHKLRNRLVHEHDSAPSRSEVERAVSQFERALRDLGALK